MINEVINKKDQSSLEKSGTYKISNVLNGKTYYGSCKQFKKRFREHKWALLKNRHGRYKHYHRTDYFQKDFNKCFKKHGNDDFLVFEVIEVIEGDKQLRVDAEQLLLNQFWDGCKQCYNINKWASSADGRLFSHTPEETRKKQSIAKKGKKLSEETKRKISEANKGKVFSDERREKISNALKGIKRSEQTCEKNSVAKKGEKHPNYGKHLSEETKRKIGDAQKRLGNKPPSRKGKRKKS